MHELSIAQSIVENVQQTMNIMGLKSVSCVAVRVGVMCGVMTDALSFGYEAVACDTPLAGSRLSILEDPLRAQCRDCGASFVSWQWLSACRDCGSADIEVKGGDSLNIAWFETEEGAS